MEYLSRANTKKLLTVVVPLFNMEHFLERCISSLVIDSVSDKIEVIIVDDGSSDNSLAFARSLEQRHKNIVKVIAKQNGGHGSAINVGLAAAQGDYFRVVDSDDWVDALAFHKFIRRLEIEDADLVLTDHCEYREKDRLLVFQPFYSNLTDGKLYQFDYLCDSVNGFKGWGPVLSTSTFKTLRLRQAGLFLDEKIAYVDMEYVTLSLLYISTVRYYSLDIYRYYIGRVGQTISRNVYQNRFRDHEKVIIRLCDFLEENSSLSKEKRAYLMDNILKRLIDAHHLILGCWLENWVEYQEFDRRLQRYSFLKNISLKPKHKFYIHSKIKMLWEVWCGAKKGFSAK